MTRFVLAIAFFVMGGAVTALLTSYEPVQACLRALGNDEAGNLVHRIFPAINGLTIAAGVALVGASFGYRKAARWAPVVALAALAVCFATGFFPAIPTLHCRLFPVTLPLVWLPAVVGFILVTRRSRHTTGSGFTLAVLVLFAALFAEINAIASTHRAITGRGLIYVVTQPVHVLLAVTWIVTAVGHATRRGWARRSTLVAAAVAIAAGVPLAILDALDIGRFSLFAVSPIFAVIVGIVAVRASGSVGTVETA